MRAACDDDGPCTASGHTRRLSAAGAALVNGTAAHGEDFDDTFNDMDSPQLVGPKKSKFAPQDPHKGNKTQRAEEGDTQSFLSR